MKTTRTAALHNFQTVSKKAKKSCFFKALFCHFKIFSVKKHCLVNVRVNTNKNTLKEHENKKNYFFDSFFEKTKGGPRWPFEKKLTFFLCRNFCRHGVAGGQIGRSAERSRYLLYWPQRDKDLSQKQKSYVNLNFDSSHFLKKWLGPPFDIEPVIPTHFSWHEMHKN